MPERMTETRGHQQHDMRAPMPSEMKGVPSAADRAASATIPTTLSPEDAPPRPKSREDRDIEATRIRDYEGPSTMHRAVNRSGGALDVVVGGEDRKKIVSAAALPVMVRGGRVKVADLDDVSGRFVKEAAHHGLPVKEVPVTTEQGGMFDSLKAPAHAKVLAQTVSETPEDTAFSGRLLGKVVDRIAATRGVHPDELKLSTDEFADAVRVLRDQGDEGHLSVEDQKALTEHTEQYPLLLNDDDKSARAKELENLQSGVEELVRETRPLPQKDDQRPEPDLSRGGATVYKLIARDGLVPPVARRALSSALPYILNGHEEGDVTHRAIVTGAQYAHPDTLVDTKRVLTDKGVQTMATYDPAGGLRDETLAQMGADPEGGLVVYRVTDGDLAGKLSAKMGTEEISTANESAAFGGSHNDETGTNKSKGSEISQGNTRGRTTGGTVTYTASKEGGYKDRPRVPAGQFQELGDGQAFAFAGGEVNGFSTKYGNAPDLTEPYSEADQHIEQARSVVHRPDVKRALGNHGPVLEARYPDERPAPQITGGSGRQAARDEDMSARYEELAGDLPGIKEGNAPHETSGRLKHGWIDANRQTGISRRDYYMGQFERQHPDVLQRAQRGSPEYNRQLHDWRRRVGLNWRWQ